MEKASVITPDAFYLMINTYPNSLAEVRARAEVDLEHLALVLNVNQSVLKDMESGKQRPTLRVIAIYHMLFRASYQELFKEVCADVNTLVIQRSENLIARLESSQSPKSRRMVQVVSNIVNRLATEDHE